MSAFYFNWVRTMQDIQQAGDGDLPSFVPRAGSNGDKAPTWAAIGVVVPWEFMIRSGDDSLVALGLNTTKSLIKFWQTHLDKQGLLDIVRYGDWCASPRAGPSHAWGKANMCPQMMTSHISYIEGLSRGVDLATASGDVAQAAVWRSTLTAARESFETRWWNATIGCYAQSCLGQTAQAAPFALNTTPPARMKAAAAALLGSVTGWNTSFTAGIVGTRFLPEALTKAGHGDVALKLVGRDATACSTIPATCTFSQQLAAGPGSLWESWDFDHVWTGGSLNHIM
jgi:alpha-L-rhamnosidase